MSFLAPLFLLGALAVGLPIIFHLIRRTTRERTIFSSLMFLAPSPPRLTRRSRLEHLLLLAFRCLILCLLAMGFSRPFFKKPMPANSSSGPGRRIVFLVDASASMRRTDLWSDARNRVESNLRNITPSDQVALITFARQSDTLLSFDQWTQLPISDRAPTLLHKLSENPPGWAATHLGNALLSAAESLADTGGKPWSGPRQIIVVTDLQEGSRLDQLQGYEWPKGLEVTVEQLKPRHVSNAGLQLVTDSEDSDSKATAGVRLRVSNAAGSKREAFKVGWAQSNARGFTGKPLDVYVPPGQSRIIALEATTNAPPSGVSRIILDGDEDDFDNSVFVIPPEQARLNVVYFGSDSENDPHQPLFFLKRAFQDTRRQSVRVTAQSPGQPVTQKDAALYIVTDPLPEESAQALHELAAAGKTVLVAPKNAQAASTLARLIGTDLKIDEAQPKTYAMLADIDFRHPLFAPFADPRFSDFTHIHFWKYRRLEPGSIPGAHILAKFDSGDPAVIEAPVGQGRIFIFASGWNRDDSQLALSTKFVPMLYALLETTGEASPLPTQYYVGDVVPLPSLAGAAQTELTVRQPDGVDIKMNADTTNFSRTLTPGIYEVASAAGKPARFVVNLDPNESRTAPLPIDELERLGVPMARQSAVASREPQRQARLQNAELESRQKLWRWILAGTLIVVLGETWLASRASRQVAQPA